MEQTYVRGWSAAAANVEPHTADNDQQIGRRSILLQLKACDVRRSRWHTSASIEMRGPPNAQAKRPGRPAPHFNAVLQNVPEAPVGIGLAYVDALSPAR